MTTITKIIGDAKSGDYIVPRRMYVGRGDETEALYALEEKRTHAIRSAAKELGGIMGCTEEEYWNKTLPQALFDVLENIQDETSVAAAVGFLQQKGWALTPPADVEVEVVVANKARD